MKAAFINKHGGPETLEVGDLPTPVPSYAEVLVRMEYAALNHLDLWTRRGLPSHKLAFPHILGADGAGVVEALGPNVFHVKKGDAVVIHPGLSCLHCEACLSGWETLCRSYQILGEHLNGTMSELVKVPAANVFLKPDTLSFPEAAAVALVFTTAWHMVNLRARVQPAEQVLIHSAGSGVSSAAIQLARLLGAEVIATAGSDSKLALARALGAEHIINYKRDDFLERVKQITTRRGVDVVLDHTGQDLWEKNLKVLRRGGRLVTCGATSGYSATTDLRQIFYRQLQLLGSTMGSKSDFPTILRLLERKSIRAVVDKVFPLGEIAAAHRYLESRDQFGKVVIKIR